MRVKNLCIAKAIPATATSAVTTTVDLTVDPQLFPFGQGGSAVVVISLEGATGGTGGGSVAVLTATDGTTFATAKDDSATPVSVSVTLPATAGYGNRMFTIKNIGQAMKVKVKGLATGGAGKVSAYLIQE